MTSAKHLRTICRLVQYELKKLLQNRFFLLAGGILFLAELALSVEAWSNIGSYRKVAAMVVKPYEWIVSADETELENFREKMIQKYGEYVLDSDVPVFTDPRLFNLPGYLVDHKLIS